MWLFWQCLLVLFFVGEARRNNKRQTLDTLESAGLIVGDRGRARILIQDVKYKEVINLSIPPVSSWGRKEFKTLYGLACENVRGQQSNLLGQYPLPTASTCHGINSKECSERTSDATALWNAAREIDTLINDRKLTGRLAAKLENDDDEKTKIRLAEALSCEQAADYTKYYISLHLLITGAKLSRTPKDFGSIYEVTHPGRFVLNGSYYIYPQLPDVFRDKEGAIHPVEKCTFQDSHYVCPRGHGSSCNLLTLEGCPMQKIDARSENFMFSRTLYSTTLIATHFKTYKLDRMLWGAQTVEVPNSGIFTVNCSPGTVLTLGGNSKVSCQYTNQNGNEDGEAVEIEISMTDVERRYIEKLEGELA